MRGVAADIAFVSFCMLVTGFDVSALVLVSSRVPYIYEIGVFGSGYGSMGLVETAIG